MEIFFSCLEFLKIFVFFVSLCFCDPLFVVVSLVFNEGEGGKSVQYFNNNY